MLRRVLLASFRFTLPTPRLYMRTQNAFSVANHPTIDKIMKSEDVDSMQAALLQIGGLSEKSRQLALKIVLNKIFSAKIPLSLLDGQKLAAQLAKHPHLLLEALLFRIKELMKSLNESHHTPQHKAQAFNAVNDNFLKCFETLKRVSGPLSTKYEVMLHKRFADYNLLYLSKNAKQDDRKQFLQKSKEFYSSALIKMDLLIREEQEKLNKLTESTSERQEKPQEEELKTNAIRENIRLLIETNSENVFHLFMAEKELCLGRGEGELPQSIIGLLPYFQKALAYYQILKKMTQYSIFYHRLKKLALQIDYYSKILAFRKHKDSQSERIQEDHKLWKQLLEQLDGLYKETVEDIKAIVKEPKHMGSLQEMTLLLLNIQVHKTLRQHLSVQELKEKLLLQVGTILELISPEEKRAIASHLGKVVKQMLQERQGKQ